MKKSLLIVVLGSILLFSCVSKTAQPIQLNVDNCDFCKMTITNAHFATQLITEKGRCYKFDDVMCMIQYSKIDETTKNATFYVTNFANENQFIAAEKAYYLQGGTINSPMRGNTIALSTGLEVTSYQKKFNAQTTTWNKIYAQHK